MLRLSRASAGEYRARTRRFTREQENVSPGKLTTHLARAEPTVAAAASWAAVGRDCVKTRCDSGVK